MSRLASAALVALGLAEGARIKRHNSTASCGEKGSSVGGQIVGGEAADQCEWKWQVGLTRSSSPSLPFCGGMLVSEEWVLTAAHCVTAPDFFVVLGDWKPRNPSDYVQKIRASEVYRHPRYSSSFSHDYALVKLERPAAFSACVGTVCMPTEDVAAGSTCWITGWGTLRSGGSQPDTLQEVAVNIISNDDCVNKYGYTSSQIDDSMVCAQGRNSNGEVTDACQGDSGGPLVCENGGIWSIYGATSWGRGCAGANYPGIWARVNYVTEWIESVKAGTYTTPKPVTCPSFASSTYPDGDGDCKCRSNEKCSTNGGSSWNCPTSGSLGGYGGSYFLPDCEDCQCYSSR
jgi:secreted trypsin-like serine protease